MRCADDYAHLRPVNVNRRLRAPSASNLCSAVQGRANGELRGSIVTVGEHDRGGLGL